MEDEQRTVISTVCHLWYSTPWKMSSGLSSAQSVIFGKVPQGRWAADCHQHSLSSSVQYPMEDEQRTVISTVCHLRYIASYRWPQDKIYLHISLNDLCDFRSAQMMCNHVLQQLPWKAPASSARLLLACGSSVWPNSALDFYHTQSELVWRANSWTGPYMPK